MLSAWEGFTFDTLKELVATSAVFVLLPDFAARLTKRRFPAPKPSKIPTRQKCKPLIFDTFTRQVEYFRDTLSIARRQKASDFSCMARTC